MTETIPLPLNYNVISFKQHFIPPTDVQSLLPPSVGVFGSSRAAAVWAHLWVELRAENKGSNSQVGTWRCSSGAPGGAASSRPAD